MKVKCLGIQLNEKQNQSLGISQEVRSKYQLTVDKIYTVLGVAFHIKSYFYGSGVAVDICDDAGRCASVPLCLFEIVDHRPSQFWRIRQHDDGGCTIWPDEFYKDYFHDDLSEGIPEVSRLFSDLVKRIEEEF